MCAGLVSAQLFAEAHSFRNDRIFPAANFQFVAVRIFKEKCVVAGAVTYADFRSFQSFPASFAHQFRDAVRFNNGREILLQQLQCCQRVEVLSLSSGDFEHEGHRRLEEEYQRIFLG